MLRTAAVKSKCVNFHWIAERKRESEGEREKETGGERVRPKRQWVGNLRKAWIFSLMLAGLTKYHSFILEAHNH